MSTQPVASGVIRPYYFGITRQGREREYVVFLVYRASMRDYVGQVFVKYFAANRLERRVVQIEAKIVEQAGESWISHAIESACRCSQQLLSRSHPVMSLSQGEETFQRSARRVLFEASIVDCLRDRPCPGSDNEVPTCFICFNVSESDVGDFLRDKLVLDIELAGFKVHFCFRDLEYSDNLFDFMDEAYYSDRAVVVCTPALKKKVEDKVLGVSYEVSLVNGARKVRDGSNPKDVFPLFYSGSREESAPNPWFLTCFAAKLFADSDDAWEDNYFETAFKFIAALKGMSRNEAGDHIELWRKDLQNLPDKLSREKTLDPGERLDPLLSEEHMEQVTAWYETTTFKTFEAVHKEHQFHRLVKENHHHPGLVDKARELRGVMSVLLQENMDNLSYNERLLHELWRCKTRLEESLELISKNGDLTRIVAEVYYLTLEGIWFLCWSDPRARQPRHGDERASTEHLVNRLLKELPEETTSSTETKFYLNCSKQAVRCLDVGKECWEMYKRQVHDKSDITQITNFLKHSYKDAGVAEWYSEVCPQILFQTWTRLLVGSGEGERGVARAIASLHVLGSNQIDMPRDEALSSLGALVHERYKAWVVALDYFIRNFDLSSKGIDPSRQVRQFALEHLFELTRLGNEGPYPEKSRQILQEIGKKLFVLENPLSEESFSQAIMEPSFLRALPSFCTDLINSVLKVGGTLALLASGAIAMAFMSVYSLDRGFWIDLEDLDLLSLFFLLGAISEFIELVTLSIGSAVSVIATRGAFGEIGEWKELGVALGVIGSIYKAGELAMDQAEYELFVSYYKVACGALFLLYCTHLPAVIRSTPFLLRFRHTMRSIGNRITRDAGVSRLQQMLLLACLYWFGPSLAEDFFQWVNSTLHNVEDSDQLLVSTLEESQLIEEGE